MAKNKTIDYVICSNILLALIIIKKLIFFAKTMQYLSRLINIKKTNEISFANNFMQPVKILKIYKNKMKEYLV